MDSSPWQFKRDISPKTWEPMSPHWCLLTTLFQETMHFIRSFLFQMIVLEPSLDNAHQFIDNNGAKTLKLHVRVSHAPAEEQLSKSIIEVFQFDVASSQWSFFSKKIAKSFNKETKTIPNIPRHKQRVAKPIVYLCLAHLTNCSNYRCCMNECREPIFFFYVFISKKRF